MSIKCYGVTDTGSKRNENQDCFGIYELGGDITLCVVCDGMGGHAAGATAAGIARDVFCRAVNNSIAASLSDVASRRITTETFKLALERGVVLANKAVRNAAEEDKSLAGMGTTLVALLISPAIGACLVNVGDSRMYDITSEAMTQLTRDHSYVQHLVDLGKLSVEEARTSPVRNVITRAVGIDEAVRPDIKAVDITPPADGRPRRILLCSDGLSGCIDDDIIKTVVCDSGTLKEKAEGLISLANAAGGPDNITALLIEL